MNANSKARRVQPIALALVAQLCSAYLPGLHTEECLPVDDRCNAVIPLMLKYDSNLSDFRVEDRHPINNDLSVVAVSGSHSHKGIGDWVRVVGIFIIDHRTSRPYMTIEIYNAEAGELVRLGVSAEREHPYIGVSNFNPDLYSGPGYKYYYDLETKEVVNVDNLYVQIEQVVTDGDSLFLIGHSHKHGVVITRIWESNKDASLEYEIIDNVDGEKIQRIEVIDRRDDEIRLISDTRHYSIKQNKLLLLNKPEPFCDQYWNLPLPGVEAYGRRKNICYQLVSHTVETPFSQGRATKFMVWNRWIGNNGYFEDYVSGIYDISAEQPMFYPAPLIDPNIINEHRKNDKKLRKRPRVTKTVVGEIYGFHPVGDKIWFGAMLHDKEAWDTSRHQETSPELTVVNHIGYFDTAKKSYEIIYSELADSYNTVAAFFVENGNIWYNPGNNHEYGSNSEGLIRYNIGAGKKKHFQIYRVVNVIRKWKNKIVVGTWEGAYLIDGDKVINLAYGKNRNNELFIIMD